MYIDITTETLAAGGEKKLYMTPVVILRTLRERDMNTCYNSISAVSSSEKSLNELSDDVDILPSSCSARISGEAYLRTYSGKKNTQ